MDPYIILNVSEDANDAAIKSAFLEAMRQFPPEHAPEEFETIRAAYDAIKDQRKRIKRRLFCEENVDIETMLCAFIEDSTSPISLTRHLIGSALKESVMAVVKEHLHHARD